MTKKQKNQPIRVGIVGAGTNTKVMHIPGLQAIDGVEIVSVCNRSVDSAKRVAKEFDIPEVYEHWWELVAADDTDAIVIGTWPYMHCRATLAALEAGKHVMCEARMAMDCDEALQMRDAAQANPHLVAQVVPSPFTLGVDRTVQRLISEGYLGDPLVVEVRANGNAFLDQESPMNWRQDVGLSGMNIMTMGIWYEALMRWVGEATEVSAMAETFVKMRPDADTGQMHSVQVPDHINVIAKMACGAQAHISVSSVMGFSGPIEFSLYGSEGTIRFANNQLCGGQKSNTELKPIEIPSEEASGWRVEEEFINAIWGQEEITHTSFEDGVKYMAFTEAVNQSIAEGCSVPIL